MNLQAAIKQLRNSLTNGSLTRNIVIQGYIDDLNGYSLTAGLGELDDVCFSDNPGVIVRELMGLIYSSTISSKKIKCP